MTENQFQLSKDFLTMQGTFYPTHHIMAMFPAEVDRGAIVTALDEFDGTYYILEPRVIIDKIGAGLKDANTPLPSVGTEINIVHSYVEFAEKNHWGILIEAKDDTEEIIEALSAHSYSIAKKYRMLVIESFDDPIINT